MSEYLNKVVYLTQLQYDTLKSGTAVGPETQIETNNIYVTDSVLGSSTDIAAIKTDLGLGGAAAKDIDTSISAGDTSTDVPTTAAVASFVEGKNYVSSTGSTGDLLYWSNTNTTSHLAAGTNGLVLTLSNGVPSWGSASGNLIVIIPVTYSSSTYSITYTYDELKALIVAGKIVVLSYNTEFYYLKHDNNIGSNDSPTLNFNSLNVNSGTQYYFYISKNTSTGAANIYRSSNNHTVSSFSNTINHIYYDDSQNKYVLYLLNLDAVDISLFVEGYYEIIGGNTNYYLVENLEVEDESVALGYHYPGRAYFLTETKVKEIDEGSGNYNNLITAYYRGIILLNGEQTLRTIVILGKWSAFDADIISITDISLENSGSSYSGVTTLTWDDTNKKITKTIDGTTTTDVVEFEAGSNVTLTGSTGKLTIAATDTTYSSLQAASGGTTESLVTTGEKYTWNNKQDALVFNTAYNSSTNKVATMSDVGVTSVTTAWDDTNKKITLSINNGTASDILEFEAGSNITLTPASGKLTIAATNTNDAVTQTATTTDSAYEVLFSGTADNTTRTEGARKTSTLKYNPSTKTLTIDSGTITASNYSGKAATAGTADSANSVALSNVSGASDLQAIEALTGTSGFLEKTAADTWLLSSITIPSASSTTPSDLGTAAAGSSTEYARADHVHKKPSLSDIGASETAVSGGTTVSLVTTGEKYTWNNKQEKMVILSYGSSTWQNFLDAYNNNAVIYCRASSGSNPASGAQTRLAFMAYINANPPTTEVEFQYYRSVNSHSATQMSDLVYVYKLNKNNGWSVTTREASLKLLSSGVGIDVSYSNNAATVKTLLVSETALTNAATAATEVSGRVYPVAVDANGKLAVNVPWESGGSGDVVGPSSAVSGNVATFSGTTGKLVLDSGYTIATSVPANAIFTDTTTSVSYSTTPASVNVNTTGATGSIVLGEAATKQVDSTVTSSSTNLPTSAAVATYVLQNAGSADWESIVDESMDTTDSDYDPGDEYLYNHIRPSYKDTIIGNNMTVTRNGYVTAANVKTAGLRISDGAGEWVWTPTSTGLELTYVVYE